MAGHPSTIIFLTADAFGVLPPIARLTREQAMYHFISGYTAKLAGTEVGVKEPTATFSTCFGAPFMPRHPSVYAGMLGERMDQLRRAGLAREHRLDAAARTAPVRAHEHRPHAADGPRRAQRPAGRRSDEDRSDLRHRGARRPAPMCPREVLWPRDTWADKDAYDRQAQKLAGMFVENFKQFEDGCSQGDRGRRPTPADEGISG